MRWISIFLIISFFYTSNVFAGSDDFFAKFEDAFKDAKLIDSINIPADKTHLYTVLDNLKKSIG